MKRLLSCLLALAAMIPTASAASVSAASAILYEPETGTVLFEKNADDRRLIASTTKIMTALLALENRALSETVTIPAECGYIEGSSMHLAVGEEYSLEELLYGLMLESGNDAAVAIAIHVAGSVRAFADMMNERAEALGCLNTHFTNPNGLDDGMEHYSSARDLAMITAEAIDNPAFVRIASTTEAKAGGRSYANHNRLLTECEGVFGVKTGYTRSAGRTLVTACRRGDTTLIAVTLSDPDDWADHMALYDEWFSRVRLARLEAEYSLPVISGTAPTVGAHACGGCVLVPVGSVVTRRDGVRSFVYAPTEKGSTVGTAAWYLDGEEIGSADIVLTESVMRDEGQRLSKWEEIKRLLVR